MKGAFLLLLLVLISVCHTRSDVEAAPAGCHGKINSIPLINGTRDMKMKAENGNGRLYTIDAIEPAITVLHLYGTASEMGHAQGTLLKDNINTMFVDFWQWIDEQLDEILHFLPKLLIDLVEKYGLRWVLEWQYQVLKPYIAQHWHDEIEGIAAGAGVSVTDVAIINIFPELVKAHCSIVGVWGEAMATNSAGNAQVQLRALDWAMNGPFQKYPTLLVYHPADANSNTFTILTYPGFISTLTGFSEAPIGICEKVWLKYNGTDHRAGYPWTFMLRDILQFDKSVDEALSRLINSKRTCSIFVGLGDTSESHVKIVEYSVEQLNIYDDQNFQVDNPLHPQFKDVVYVDKHTQPTHDQCMGNIIKANYGLFTAETLFRHVTAQQQTGNTHAAVYDFQSMNIFVSNAGPYNATTKYAQPAYERQWTQFDLNVLFSEKKA